VVSMIFFRTLTPQLVKIKDEQLKEIHGPEGTQNEPTTFHEEAWECRLDLLNCVPEFLKQNRFKLLWMATYRSKEHGGRGEAHLRDTLGWDRRIKAVRQGAQWIDLEWDESNLNVKINEARSLGAKTVLSGHFFEKVKDWEKIYMRLSEVDPDIIKLIGSGNSFQDFRTQRSCYKEAGKPLVHFFMGEEFKSTRILSLYYGAPFTFVAPSSHEMVAPGQLNENDVRTLSECDFNRKSPFFAIAGYPVSHSRSPEYHRGSLKVINNNVQFLHFPIQYEKELEDVWELFPELVGLSVTKPLKTIASKQCKSDDLASVNTLIKHKSHLAGFNTDAHALKNILETIQKEMDIEKPVVRIIGYGGLGSMAVVVAQDLGYHVQVTNRTFSRLQNCEGGVEKIQWEQRCEGECHVLLQATSLGMGNSNETPIEKIPNGTKYFIETIYYPKETMLLKMALDLGITCFNGAHFFDGQAEEQNRHFCRALKKFN